MPDRPAPVTVGDLLAALQTYPPNALVFTAEAGTGCGSIFAKVGSDYFDVWEGVTSEGNWHDGNSARMLAVFEAERPRPYPPAVETDH